MNQNVLSLKLNNLDAWLHSCSGLQSCIRTVGKLQVAKIRENLSTLESNLKILMQKVKSGSADVGTCKEIESIRTALLKIAESEVARARFKCRISQLEDTHDTSKGFFKKLKAKHKSKALTKLISEDGTVITDGQKLMQKCVGTLRKFLMNQLMHQRKGKKQ